MKKLTIYCFLALFCSITFYACKKNEVKPIVDKTFKQADGGCLISEINDNQAYDLKFTYDYNGNPITESGTIFGGPFNISIAYDAQNRLKTLVYSPTSYREYEYSDNTFLPSGSKVYNVSYGSNVSELVANDQFTYNSAGLMTKFDEINAYGTENIWQYTYDAKGNLATITKPGQTAPVYQATGYDNKPILTGGNQWMKYILLDYNNGYTFYYYLLNNTNNATTWALNDLNAGFVNPQVLSYYQYNSQGYAIKDSTVFFDPINGNYTDVQINSFTCK